MIRVSKDKDIIYVNVGHHGRFYANLSKNVISVIKNKIGSYKITYTGPWETEEEKLIGKSVTKTYYFTVNTRYKKTFDKVFNIV